MRCNSHYYLAVCHFTHFQTTSTERNKKKTNNFFMDFCCCSCFHFSHRFSIDLSFNVQFERFKGWIFILFICFWFLFFLALFRWAFKFLLNMFPYRYKIVSSYAARNNIYSSCSFEYFPFTFFFFLLDEWCDRFFSVLWTLTAYNLSTNIDKLP